jgi:hypothetical protein
MRTVFLIICGILTGILLIGCASINSGKDTESEPESTQRIDNLSTASKDTSGSSSAVRKEPDTSAGGSGGKQIVPATESNVVNNMLKHNAAYLKQALDRILPETMSELNWNRIATVFTGILVIAMIYGLAFGLGRLSIRRRGAASRGGSG